MPIVNSAQPSWTVLLVNKQVTPSHFTRGVSAMPLLNDLAIPSAQAGTSPKEITQVRGLGNQVMLILGTL